MQMLVIGKTNLGKNNVRDKYNRDYNYAMSLRGAGNQNFTGGLDKIASSAAMFGVKEGLIIYLEVGAEVGKIIRH